MPLRADRLNWPHGHKELGMQDLRAELIEMTQRIAGALDRL